MTPLLLIAAVEAETTALQRLMEGARPLECAQRKGVKGRLNGREVILLCSGVGKANAAATTAVALERFTPHGVINFGSAGAYLDSGLGIGDLVLSREEVMADEGVACEEKSFLDFEALGFPTVERPSRRYNRFPAPTKLLDRAEEVLTTTAGQLKATLLAGTSLTVSSCSGTTERGNLLARRWQGNSENMEGAAVAQVCSSWGIPWLGVRSISNLVEDRDTSTWDLPRAGKNAQEAARSLVEQITPEEWQT